MRRFLAVLALLCIATQAQADRESAVYATVGLWQVRIDTSLNNACYIAAGYERGSVLRIGFANDGAYVAIGDTRWQSLEVGKKYHVILRVDQLSPWEGNYSVVRIGTLPMLTIKINGARFLREVAEGQWLAISYRGRVITNLRLTGSYAAIMKMAECQRAMGVRQADPFAVPRPRTTTDPFL